DAEAKGDARKQLHASLALLPVDPSQVEYLYGRLLTGEPQEVVVLRDALRPHADTLTGRLWAVLGDATGDPGRRFRALVALARFDPGNPRWQTAGKEAVAPLLTADPLHVSVWSAGLRDVRESLLGPLGEAFRDKGRPAERRVAASVLADYA